MLVSFLQHTIRLMEFEAEYQLLEFLHSRLPDMVMLGEEAESAKKFFAVELRPAAHLEPCWTAGIRSNGLTPELYMDRESSCLLLGFNESVARVQVPPTSPPTIIPLPFVFYTFLSVPHLRHVFVVHELGVVALDPSGETLWSVESDVLTRYDVDGDLLRLEFMDSEAMSVRLVDGQVEGS